MTCVRGRAPQRENDGRGAQKRISGVSLRFGPRPPRLLDVRLDWKKSMKVVPSYRCRGMRAFSRRGGCSAEAGGWESQAESRLPRCVAGLGSTMCVWARGGTTAFGSKGGCASLRIRRWHQPTQEQREDQPRREGAERPRGAGEMHAAQRGEECDEARRLGEQQLWSREEWRAARSG